MITETVLEKEKGEKDKRNNLSSKLNKNCTKIVRYDII